MNKRQAKYNALLFARNVLDNTIYEGGARGFGCLRSECAGRCSKCEGRKKVEKEVKEIADRLFARYLMMKGQTND